MHDQKQKAGVISSSYQNKGAGEQPWPTAEKTTISRCYTTNN